MSQLPDVNRQVPQVASPMASTSSLVVAVQALKQGMDSLAGYRGGLFDRAVTYRDLVSLGLVDEVTIESERGQQLYAPEDSTTVASIAAEAATRIAADNTLQTNINTETAARIAADSAEAAARAFAVGSEATARTTADSTEAAARIAADAILSGALNALVLAPVSFASVSGAPAPGRLAHITDSTVAAWGAVVAGGGPFNALIWYNGVDWKVFAA